MDLEQYIGCIIMYNNRMATVVGTRSNYDGDFFRLKYLDSDTEFSVNAFEDVMLEAIPLAALACSRPEMNFTFAAGLVQTADEGLADHKNDSFPKSLLRDIPDDPEPQTMKYCPNCGKKNDGGKYCTACGTKLLTN